MNALKKMFGTNPELEKKGIVLEYGDGADAFTIRIKRAGGANTHYERVLDIVSKPHKRAILGDNIDPKVVRKIMIEVYAKSVVIGWSGVTDDEGKPLEFNEKNFTAKMNEFPDLFNDIQEQAQKMVLFKTHVLEDEAKNSESSTTTS